MTVDKQGETYLVHGRGAQHIHVGSQAGDEPVLDDAPARLDQELPLAPPPVLEVLGGRVQLVPDEVVEHDNVGARADRLVRLGLGLALDVDEEGEAGDLARAPDRLGDASCGISDRRSASRRRARVRVKLCVLDRTAFLYSYW